MVVMYVGTEEGVVAALRDGERWRVERRTLAEHDVWALAVCPANSQTVFAGSYGGGLYRSRDNAQTWERVGAEIGFDYVRSILCAPGQPDTIYVGAEPANVFRSADGGDTWADLSIRRLPEADDWYLPYSPRGGAVRSLSIHPNRPQQVYSALEVGGVLASADTGATWSVEATEVHPDVHQVVLHPQNPQVMFAATGGGLYRTQDGGETWGELIDDYTRSVAFDADAPQKVFAGPARYVGGAGRIMQSTDGGDHWQLAINGLENPMHDMVELFVVHPLLPGEIFAVTSGGRLLHSRIDDVNWRPVEAEIDDVQCVDFVGG